MRLVVVQNVLRFCQPLQTSSEGKRKRKAELVEQAFNAHSMKLVKVSEEESENENLIMAELLATDEGVLPDPASILKSNCSRNLTIFPEFTSPDVCNYLLGKTDEYSEETQNILKALRVINFSKMVCLFPLFAPHSPEPRLGVGVSSPVCHAEIRPLFLKYRCSTVTSHFHLHLLLLCW